MILKFAAMIGIPIIHAISYFVSLAILRFKVECIFPLFVEKKIAWPTTFPSYYTNRSRFLYNNA